MSGFDTVVVSDIHLGARNSRGADLVRFFEEVPFDRLVVNGDLFDSPRFRRMRPQDFMVLDALRGIAEQRSVEWILGNHDPAPAAFSAMLGVKASDEIALDLGGCRYLVCHGHRWDRSLEAPGAIVAGADAIYFITQCLDPTHHLSRSLKRLSKVFCNVSDAIQRGGVKEAAKRGFDGIILGHSHLVSDLFAEEGVHFVNGGCWTERPCSFVGIRGNDVRAYLWEADEFYPLHHRRVSGIGEARPRSPRELAHA
jgi:UDP-2,3-diacylglucosamine pyrophosphatase LpxH